MDIIANKDIHGMQSILGTGRAQPTGSLPEDGNANAFSKDTRIHGEHRVHGGRQLRPANDRMGNGGEFRAGDSGHGD